MKLYIREIDIYKKIIIIICAKKFSVKKNMIRKFTQLT